jgi:hypothetical protein
MVAEGKCLMALLILRAWCVFFLGAVCVAAGVSSLDPGRDPWFSLILSLTSCISAFFVAAGARR